MYQHRNWEQKYVVVDRSLQFWHNNVRFPYTLYDRAYLEDYDK